MLCLVFVGGCDFRLISSAFFSIVSFSSSSFHQLCDERLDMNHVEIFILIKNQCAYHSRITKSTGYRPSNRNVRPSLQRYDQINMNDENYKSVTALTSRMLNDSNWQLWRKEVTLGMQRMNAYRIMIGDEPRPNTVRPTTAVTEAPHAPTSTSELSRTSRRRVADAIRKSDVARQALSENPDNEELHNQLLTAEAEI